MKNTIILFLLLLSYNTIFAQGKLSEASKTKLDALIEAAYQDNKPGGIVTILKKGQPIYSNWNGLSNVEYDIPISENTVFNIGSLSKQFTAFIALMLEEEGKLSLDDDIIKYLPELDQLPYKISVRQLLNHTHGLPNSLELAQLCGKDGMNHQEMVSMLLKTNTTTFKPGNKFMYNNTGYVLTAEIISRVAGKPFQDVLAEKVFAPLKMKNSAVINYPSQVVKNKAASYSFRNETYSYLFNDNASMGPGGICTDINDLSLWANNFVNPKVGNRNITMEMQKQTRLNSGELIDYGLGIQSKKYKGEDIVFHGGADAAYRSYLMHLPEHDLTIVSLSNNGSFSALEISYSITDVLLGLNSNEKMDSATKTELANEMKNSYGGTYEMFPGKYFNIISRNDSLFFQQFGYNYEIPLAFKKETTYTIPMLPHYEIVFGENKFDFHIVDTKFDCQKIKINPPKFTEQELSKFVGVFQNEAFGIIYRIAIKNGKLVASSGYNSEILLSPLADLSFYSDYQYFGKIDFDKNNDGKYDRFNLSGSFLKDIVFIRI